MNAQSRTWLKVWAVILVIFALGCVTGAAIDGLYRSRTVSAPGSPNAPGSPPLSLRDGEAYFQTLQRELNLAPDQQLAVRGILDDTRTQYRGVCADVRPRYDRLRDAARARMRALLTAAQQQRFDAIVTQEDCRCPDPK